MFNKSLHGQVFVKADFRLLNLCGVGGIFSQKRVLS
jgi:hypothetical protein